MSSKPSSDPEKQEPKENDKCMETANNEESDWRKRLGDFSERTKHFASNRYKVVLTILCIILFIFFIIIIALAVKLGTCGVVEEVSPCSSEHCLRASAGVVSKMNDTLDPCEDFYEYACGQWVAKHSKLDRSGSYSVIDKVKGDVYERTRLLLDLISFSKDEHSPEGKAKLFFSTCSDTSDIDFWSKRNLQTWIENELGGWRVPGQGGALHRKMNDLLLHVHAVYGARPFFKLGVSSDDRNPMRNIIKISPSGIGLPDKKYYFVSEKHEYVRAYKKFIQDIVRELHPDPTYDKRFAENMFNYEKRIAEIMPEPEKELNPDKYYEVVTVEQLNAIASIVKWSAFFERYYPSATISKMTEVGLFSKGYFSRLSNLLSTTDDTSLNNYILWQLILHYLPHLPQQYRDIANRFYQTLEGVEDPDVQREDRWEFCLGQTFHYFGHVLGSLYVKKYFMKTSEHDIQRMVDNILAELSTAVNSLEWLVNTRDKEIAREKIGVLNTYIGYPEFILDEKELRSYYQALQVKSSAHINNVQFAEKFLMKKEDDLLVQSNITFNKPYYYAADVEATYIYAGNKLVVPAGLLHLSIYNHNLPPGIKYAFLAGHISNRLLQMFDIKGINYEKYGTLQPWLSNRSREYYQESVSCLLESIQVDDNKLRTNLTVQNIMNEIAGVKYSYLAHKRRDETEQLLPGVKQNHDQTFFMAYAQSLCEASLPKKLTVPQNPKYGLRNNIRVMNALQQLPEFADAFGCAADSLMRSSKQCRVW